MRETLKMMKSILTGKEGKVDEKELIKEYKEKLSPNILAYFYSNNYGIIYKTSKLYPIILDEDKASFCLQELDKCLQEFELCKNIKFIPYFITCYKRRLWAENEMLNHNIRKINLICNSDIDDIQIAKSDDLILDENLILNNYDLTKTEIKQCKLLNMGYSIKEIANILKLSTITIYKRNNKIKEKILKTNINFV